MSRFTGLQFTGLPCLPVFFFRATPSPRFTGGMPVYRGESFFHARGAPPAAAHSHTRCCTQHNTTRWVLRAAANTCLHTMPCAAEELCQFMPFTEPNARASKQPYERGGCCGRGRYSAWVTTGYPRGPCRENSRTRGNVGRGGRRKNGRTAWQMIFGYLVSRGTGKPPHSTLGHYYKDQAGLSQQNSRVMCSISPLL